MDKYILILGLTFMLHSMVYGNVTVCIPTNSEKNSAEDNYSLIAKSLKSGLDELLDDNSTAFYDHLEFDFHHPAISMKGELNNLTVSNLDQYELKFLSSINLTKNEIVIFNLTLNNISFIGEYDMTGNIGDLFDIWGDGHFWANFLNFSISATTEFPIANSTTVCLPLGIKVHLQMAKSYFNNLMDDDELEEIINLTFAGIIPEVIEVIWDENEHGIDYQLQEVMDSIINGNSSYAIGNIFQMAKYNVLNT